MASAVVISANSAQRSSLAKLLGQLPRYSENVIELSEPGKVTSPPDYLFISEDFSLPRVKESIRCVREGQFGKRTTFIILCAKEWIEAEAVAEALTAGAHGVLIEPFSMKQLEEIMLNAKAFKRQGTRLRLKTAAAIMLTTAVEKLTEKEGLPKDEADFVSKVRKTCRDYKRLTGESVSIEAIQGSPLEEYKGVSKRVRELYELRLKSLIGKPFKTKPA
jgi:hypothetical protein